MKSIQWYFASQVRTSLVNSDAGLYIIVYRVVNMGPGLLKADEGTKDEES